MPGEQHMRQRVVKALKPLDAVSVENLVHPGTPDINYVEGWIECKCEKRWPTRSDTPLRVATYTPQQKVWANRRARNGGRVYLLLQVANDWLLFRGEVAAQGLGNWTKADCVARAERVWYNGLNEEELIECISAT